MARPKLTFDSRIPEEAALLERLNGLPKERHLEYIRTLAVKGFLQERAESSQRKPDLTAARVVSSGQEPQDHRRNLPEPKTERFPAEIQDETAEAPADLTLASLKQLVG